MAVTNVSNILSQVNIRVQAQNLLFFLSKKDFEILRPVIIYR